MSALGRSLELFFIDGRADGMLTAEVFNWTGHVLMAPRTQIGEALKRQEARYTGVYILIGEDEGGRSVAYIGEGEDISDRIRNHDTKKDWWTTAVLITSAANNLNKAHVKYLEARLIQEARAAGRASLENATSPPVPSLNEAGRANMEAFLEHILLVLPALRIDSFLKKARAAAVDAPMRAAAGGEASPIFELSTPKHNLFATAYLEDGEFVVLAGSKARKSWEGSPTHNYVALFNDLVSAGVLTEENEHRVFSTDYAFKSPSAAGAVINGRATNGQTSWRVQGGGMTYREWEASQLEKARRLWT